MSDKSPTAATGDVWLTRPWRPHVSDWHAECHACPWQIDHEVSRLDARIRLAAHLAGHGGVS